jgi:ABC-type phosphate/phosphonate transport system permease subunit
MVKRDILTEIGETIAISILGSVATAVFMFLLVYFS